MRVQLKNLVLWSYSRETSVYVVFCLLIIAFIFLTPKSWFDKRENLATPTTRLIVQESDYSPNRAALESRVRQLSGNPQAQIIGIRERRDDRGETVYEIDIR